MTVAISAATGQLGRLVVASLKKKISPSDIAAIARTPAKAADFGVTVRQGDYAHSETMARALTGVDKLLLISSNQIGERGEQHRNVIAAAKTSGVRLIVYTSLLHADTSPLDLAAEHCETEKALKASGIPHVILRNGWYTENYTGSTAAALAGGAFLGSARDGKISSAACADYAEAAAAVLAGDGHAGRIYELAGDTAYTLKELAAEISRQTGRDIPYRDLPAEGYAEALTKAGLPSGLAAAIAGWDVGAAQGALFDDTRQLSKLIGRPTAALSSAVATALKLQ